MMHEGGNEEIISRTDQAERRRPLVSDPNQVVYLANHVSSQWEAQTEFQAETRIVVVLSTSLADFSEARHQRSVNDDLAKSEMADARQAVRTLLLEAGVHITWMLLAPAVPILISLIVVLMALSIVLSWPRFK